MTQNRNKANTNTILRTPLPIKHCHIVKRADFDGYGFSLHSEKIKPGQYIGKVDTNSPAEAAGLKEGDRIIEVNGVNISHESHKQVVQRIKSISHEVRLLIEEIFRSNTNGRSDNTILSCRAETPRTINTDKDSENISGRLEEMPVSGINNSSVEIKQKDNSIILDKQCEKNTSNYPNAGLSHVFLWSPNETSFDPSVSKITTSTGSGQFSTAPLELPMTAAEMRAKLLLKKKYDPKNEVVDLRTKYEIIKKL